MAQSSESSFDVCGEAPPDSSSESFDVGDSALPAAKRRRRRLPAASLGASVVTSLAFLLVNGSVQPEAEAISRQWAVSPHLDPTYDASSFGIVAVVVYAWCLSAKDDAQFDLCTAAWRNQLARDHRRAKLSGYLEYKARDIYKIDGGLQN